MGRQESELGPVSRLVLVTMAWERGSDVDIQESLTIKNAGFDGGEFEISHVTSFSHSIPQSIS